MVFPRDMVYLRNISVDTLHKGDTDSDDDDYDDDDDDDDDDNNNNNITENSRIGHCSHALNIGNVVKYRMFRIVPCIFILLKFLHKLMHTFFKRSIRIYINHLNPELNPICYLLALLAHHFLHVSRIRVKSLTIRLLISFI